MREGKGAGMLVERKRKSFSLAHFPVMPQLAFTMSALTVAVRCSVVFSIVSLGSSLTVLQVLMDFTVIVGNPRYCILTHLLTDYPVNTANHLSLLLSWYLDNLLMYVWSMIRQLLLAIKSDCLNRKCCLPTGKHVYNHR